MGDAEAALPPSKRAAGRELSRDNPGLDDEEAPEQEAGTFQRASEEVLPGIRIVKVRKKETSSPPSSNPFAGISLVPSTEPNTLPVESNVTSSQVTAEASAKNENKLSIDEEKNDFCKSEENEDVNNQRSERKTDKPVGEPVKSENENEKLLESKIDEPLSKTVVDGSAEAKNSISASEATINDANSGNDNVDYGEKKDSFTENANSTTEVASLSSFRQLSSSQNAFTGVAGTGFSTSSFSFGSVVQDGPVLGNSSVSIFGQKNNQPSFGFGLSTNGNSSVSSKTEGSKVPSMQEAPIETGEENERIAFSADSVLFEYIDGGWKERGKGELKVNVMSTVEGRARLVMRAKGNLRLILNASLYPDMKLTDMEKKGITFACMNGTGEEKEGLSTFALKFKDGSIVKEFRAAIMAHKGKTPAADLKTLEGSPKASEA